MMMMMCYMCFFFEWFTTLDPCCLGLFWILAAPFFFFFFAVLDLELLSLASFFFFASICSWVVTNIPRPLQECTCTPPYDCYWRLQCWFHPCSCSTYYASLFTILFRALLMSLDLILACLLSPVLFNPFPGSLVFGAPPLLTGDLSKSLESALTPISNLWPDRGGLMLPELHHGLCSICLPSFSLVTFTNLEFL